MDVVKTYDARTQKHHLGTTFWKPTLRTHAMKIEHIVVALNSELNEEDEEKDRKKVREENVDNNDDDNDDDGEIT